MLEAHPQSCQQHIRHQPQLTALSHDNAMRQCSHYITKGKDSIHILPVVEKLGKHVFVLHTLIMTFCLWNYAFLL